MPKGVTPNLRYGNSFGVRDRWVYEWLVYRRKFCEWTWQAIANELGLGRQTVIDVYREFMGPDAYTGPLPEWVEIRAEVGLMGQKISDDPMKLEAIASIIDRLERPRMYAGNWAFDQAKRIARAVDALDPPEK